MPSNLNYESQKIAVIVYFCGRMKVGFRRHLLSFITWAILVMMGFWITNQILFMHTHVLDDGTRITHAHPYQKGGEENPFNTHQHSKTALLFFQDSAWVFILISCAVLIVITDMPALEPASVSRRLSQAIHELKSDRAPPAFLI